MKVKIAYSVDLKEVPSKVKDILADKKDVFDELNKKYDLCMRVLTEEADSTRAQMAVELIHEIRTTLQGFDQVLADAQSVITGYAAYKAQQQAEEIAEEMGAEEQPAAPAGGSQDVNDG